MKKLGPTAHVLLVCLALSLCYQCYLTRIMKACFIFYEVVSLTSKRAREIFRLPHNPDWVLVDLDKTTAVIETLSKCCWTPYLGKTLRGWPVYTIINGRCYHVG